MRLLITCLAEMSLFSYRKLLAHIADTITQERLGLRSQQATYLLPKPSLRPIIEAI